MTNKQIQNLIDKYLAGETSPAEERQLTLALHQCQELPEEWQAVSLMLGELTLGEAEYDTIMAQRHHKPSTIIIALRIISSIAAAWLIGLFLYQQATVSEPLIQSNEVPHYYTSHLSTGSTLKDVYTSRQTKHQFISYTQLRKMIYENK
jgi:hypothetical protein